MSETAFILIIEKNTDQADSLMNGLRQEGHACRSVVSEAEALESLHTRRPDVILLDDDPSGTTNGTNLLSESQQLAPDAEIIFMTPDGQRGREAESQYKGRVHVLHYVTQPVDLAIINKLVAEVAERAKRKRDQKALEEQVERRFEFEGIITTNEHLIKIIKKLQRVADSKLTVLILGESGTGKELVANALHQHSPRKAKPYRAINCAGLNENLLESELFGHVKGAFTGAVADRKGLFEIVDGGTLFLDEVGDMPMAMQAKLLRTLENGEIQPVGATEIRRVDVRLVAATRHNLRSMVDNGEFRDDLFYRLNQATIRLPPLRERREDIPLLVNHFIRQAAKLHQKKVDSISAEAIRRLSSQKWQGNIRELRSVIEQMVVLADKPQLDVEDLPESLHASTDIVLATTPSTAGLTMEQVEKLHIANTLRLTGGNREKTAKMLGIGARTLYRKLREYELQ